MFLQACVDAGPQECALHEPTASAVHARIHRLFGRLKTNPMPVRITDASPSINTPYGLITYKSVKTALFLFLYSPYTTATLGAPRLASALRDVENGDGVALWGLLNSFEEKFSCDCPIIPGEPTPFSVSTPDAQQAIMCTDGDDVFDTVEDLESHFELLAADSEFADVFPTRGNACK